MVGWRDSFRCGIYVIDYVGCQEITENNMEDNTKNIEVNKQEHDFNPHPGWMWIKDSTGAASASLTFATVAFWVTTITFFLSIIQKVGPFEFREFDSGACAAFLVPTLGLYFSRRYTISKFNEQS